MNIICNGDTSYNIVNIPSVSGSTFSSGISGFTLTSNEYSFDGLCPNCHKPYIYIGDPMDWLEGYEPFCTCVRLKLQIKDGNFSWEKIEDKKFGWICPRCKSSISPYIDVCPNCSREKNYPSDNSTTFNVENFYDRGKYDWRKYD